ncbi:hypothetical protein Q9189_007098 [Teloschistes chrysophthalmus]
MPPKKAAAAAPQKKAAAASSYPLYKAYWWQRWRRHLLRPELGTLHDIRQRFALWDALIESWVGRTEKQWSRRKNGNKKRPSQLLIRLTTDVCALSSLLPAKSRGAILLPMVISGAAIQANHAPPPHQRRPESELPVPTGPRQLGHRCHYLLWYRQDPPPAMKLVRRQSRLGGT